MRAWQLAHTGLARCRVIASRMVGGFSGYRGPDGTLVVPGWKDAELPVSRDTARAWDALKGP